jgi:hypothetical protein
MYIILDGMCVTKSISTGLCPDWDLWTANKLQLQLQLLLIKGKMYVFHFSLSTSVLIFFTIHNELQ